MRSVLLVLLVASACGSLPQRHYYTLTGQPPAKSFEKPFPIKLRVADLGVSRSYRREELVIRTDAHELTFVRARRWSEPVERMISMLVRQQVKRSGIAAEVQDETSTTDADFVLGGEIEAVEQLEDGRDRFAHLAVTFRLLRVHDDTSVWTFRTDTRRPVSGASSRSTARVLSDILASQTDQALADLATFLTDPTAPRPAAIPPPEPTVAAPEESLLGPDETSARNDLPELQHDDSAIPVGAGAIFAPTLSKGEREPRVGVYAGGALVAEGQHGKRIVVAPGIYEVRLGSGAVDQQLSVRLRVVEGKTTVLPTNWASLEVSVVDQTFIPFRGSYEIIEMASRDAIGLGFGADEQLGEATRVWVLKPGLYKIIRAGGTYRDRTDFATVRVEPGKLTRFTLVVDPNDGTFHGAGENDPSIIAMGGAEDEDNPWQLRAVLGGNLSFNRSDVVGSPAGWKLSFAVFFDGSARFATGPHIWLTRIEMEEGQTRVLSQDNFQNDRDRLYLNSVYTYQLLPWFGPYVRLGLETKLLPRYQDFDQPRDVQVLDAAGQVAETLGGVSRVELGGPLAPTQLKQGAGGNFRVLRRSFLELDLRVGLGARQTIARGLRVFQVTTDGTSQLVPVDDSNLVGLEATLVALGRLSSFMTVSSELDGLVPIGSDDAVVYTWRNQVTLRLVSFISLNYRFNVTRDPSLGIGSEAQTEHDVQLRFSWVLF